MSFLLIEEYCVQPGSIDTRLDVWIDATVTSPVLFPIRSDTRGLQ